MEGHREYGELTSVAPPSKHAVVPDEQEVTVGSAGNFLALATMADALIPSQFQSR